jgi:hypothetical protein
MQIKKISAVVMAVLVALSVGAAGVAASEDPGEGILPDDDNDNTTEATSTTDDQQTPNPPAGEWSLLIDDGQTGDEPELGIDTVYAQHTSDTLYFKTEYHGNFNTHDEIDLGIFLDTDQDHTTGLNNSTVSEDGYDWYYMGDIGADYVGVAGLEGDDVWEWSNSTWNMEYDDSMYTDFDYANDTVVIGIDRGNIGNPDSIDLLIGEAKTDTQPWDYAPDKGEGSVTYELTSSDDDGGNETSDGAVTSLSPANPTVSPGSTTTVDVVVDNTGEIGAYNFSVSVSDTASVKITDVALKGSPGVQDVTISSDGSSAAAEAALASVSGTDGAVLGEVTLTATEPGSTTLETSVNTLGSVEGTAYNISDGTATATVNVQAGPGDVTGNGNAATDPDNDGVYEDVNGDGSANVLDVQSLFGNLDSDKVAASNALDMNGDGKVDILDVQSLFTQL